MLPNAALERLLAERLGLPKKAVSVVSGSTSRLKTARLAGAPEALAKALDAMHVGLAANPD